MSFTVPVDPVANASTFADNVGAQVVTVVASVLPVLVPFLLALWALKFVFGKLMMGGGGGGYPSDYGSYDDGSEMYSRDYDDGYDDDDEYKDPADAYDFFPGEGAGGRGRHTKHGADGFFRGDGTWAYRNSRDDHLG